MKTHQTIAFLALLSLLCLFAAATRGFDTAEEFTDDEYSTRLQYNGTALGSPLPRKARVERVLYRPTEGIVLPAVGLILLFIVVLSIVLLRTQRQEMSVTEERIRFVGQVSHELKTPLTNIRLYAELLEDELQDENPNARSYSRVIVKETERLSRLISNVLRFNMHRELMGRVEPVSCDVNAVVEDVLEQFGPALVLQKIAVHTGLLPTGSYSDSECLVDPDALKQILGNLISNVEKYAASGQYIGIFIQRLDSQLRISVQDRGAGIPMDQWSDVFEPFVRLTANGDSEVSGTGIGLSISRELARLHGGDLQIEESELGSLFVLSIPHQPAFSENAII